MTTDSEKREIDNLFSQVVGIFGKKCAVCHAIYHGKSTGWVFHHWEYKYGEKTYNDFRDSKGRKDRLAYHRYLIPLLLSLPKADVRRRFRLIHNTHHYQAEMYWAIYKPENFERMVKLARNINKRKFKRIT